MIETILSNMAEAIVAVNRESRILAVNPSLRSLFGITGAVEGKHLLEILRHHRIQGIISSVLADGNRHVEEITLFAPQELIFEAHGVPLIEGGEKVGALVVLHDITRLRRLENIRRDFVANVSHELRTPIAGIKGFAETLREGALEDAKHRLDFVKSIEDYADQLAALVDDLLDLSSIESGQRPPKKEPLSLLAVAREVAQSLKGAADKKKIKFEIESSETKVPADAVQMRQVFTNLMENAVKFNKEGGWVKVRQSAENGYVTISVQDSGIGIPQEDLEHVFERFYRVDKARSREMGGTGLGLSILKHIIEEHGGSVRAESRPGEGSTFYFSLPL